MKNKLSLLKISSVLITLLISIPMITIFVYLFVQDTENWEHIKNTVLFEYIYNTLFVMIGVGLLTTIIGFTTAYLTSFYTFSFSKYFDYGLILPHIWLADTDKRGQIMPSLVDLPFDNLWIMIL